VQNAFGVGDVNDCIDDDWSPNNGHALGVVGFVGPFEFVGWRRERRCLAEQRAEALEAGQLGFCRRGGGDTAQKKEQPQMTQIIPICADQIFDSMIHLAVKS
jgi:hypothetical protein